MTTARQPGTPAPAKWGRRFNPDRERGSSGPPRRRAQRAHRPGLSPARFPQSQGTGKVKEDLGLRRGSQAQEKRGSHHQEDCFGAPGAPPWVPGKSNGEIQGVSESTVLKRFLPQLLSGHNTPGTDLGPGHKGEVRTDPSPLSQNLHSAAGDRKTNEGSRKEPGSQDTENTAPR